MDEVAKLTKLPKLKKLVLDKSWVGKLPEKLAANPIISFERGDIGYFR